MFIFKISATDQQLDERSVFPTSVFKIMVMIPGKILQKNVNSRLKTLIIIVAAFKSKKKREYMSKCVCIIF